MSWQSFNLIQTSWRNEPDLTALCSDVSAVLQELLKAGYTEAELDRDIAMGEAEAATMNNEDMEVDMTLPDPRPSSSYYLELNPNRDNPCYMDAFVELLWHSVLPHIDIEQIAAQSNNPTGMMLYQTFRMVQYPMSRIHASERMRHFVWNQNDMHDVIDSVEDFMQQTLPLLASNFKYDLEQYNIQCYGDQNHACFIDPKPAECITLNSILPSFSPSIIEKYRLTESSQGFADAFMDLCIKKQASKSKQQKGNAQHAPA
ncbi:hypothetical protein VTP01DRAFT_8689 [Rhizomucor pusillus]|uniref:uncharacterized protein n=1 Tax=Rhizomucor pusillus TaxID=4840 RepID=UPI003742ED2A